MQKKMNRFEYHSLVYQWLKVVATHFFIKKRQGMIENSRRETLYTSSGALWLS